MVSRKPEEFAPVDEIEAEQRFSEKEVFSIFPLFRLVFEGFFQVGIADIASGDKRISQFLFFSDFGNRSHFDHYRFFRDFEFVLLFQNFFEQLPGNEFQVFDEYFPDRFHEAFFAVIELYLLGVVQLRFVGETVSQEQFFYFERYPRHRFVDGFRHGLSQRYEIAFFLFQRLVHGCQYHLVNRKHSQFYEEFADSFQFFWGGHL
jgi:hypothetical protein